MIAAYYEIWVGWPLFQYRTSKSNFCKEQGIPNWDDKCEWWPAVPCGHVVWPMYLTILTTLASPGSNRGTGAYRGHVAWRGEKQRRITPPHSPRIGPNCIASSGWNWHFLMDMIDFIMQQWVPSGFSQLLDTPTEARLLANKAINAYWLQAEAWLSQALLDQSAALR